MLVYLCHHCSHLLAGDICYEHHGIDCNEHKRTSDHRPFPQHNMNPALLCKWVDCNKCKLQNVIARAKTGSFTSRRFRVICWARMVFLLTARLRVKLSWKLTCRMPQLDYSTFGNVIDFLL